MSRGGRGGGRGGRGGKKNPYPWDEDKSLKLNFSPSEAFPPYNVPIPSAVTEREKAQVRAWLLVREQIHDGPLYTAARSYNNAASASGATTPRAYGQEQINQRYGKKDKGTLDPFTAIDMPSSRMKRPARALPDFSTRPFCLHLFPEELHATINGEDGPAGAAGAKKTTKKKTMTLSKGTLRGEEIFGHLPSATLEDGLTDEERQKKLLEQLERLDETAGGEDEEEFDPDGEQYEEEMDEAYDDDDGGDYDAEMYFDGGDDDDMDDGGGDDGVY